MKLEARVSGDGCVWLFECLPAGFWGSRLFLFICQLLQNTLLTAATPGSYKTAPERWRAARSWVSLSNDLADKWVQLIIIFDPHKMVDDVSSPHGDYCRHGRDLEAKQRTDHESGWSMEQHWHVCFNQVLVVSPRIRWPGPCGRLCRPSPWPRGLSVSPPPSPASAPESYRAHTTWEHTAEPTLELSFLIGMRWKERLLINMSND